MHTDFASSTGSKETQIPHNTITNFITADSKMRTKCLWRNHVEYQEDGNRMILGQQTDH